MIKGQELSDIAAQILSDKNHKRDYLADTRNVRVGTRTITEGDPLDPKTPRRVVPVVRFTVEKKEMEFDPSRRCMDQIGDRVGIPRKYADKLIETAPDLLATNVNHWFQNTPEKRMLRTLQNGSNVARAFLSDRYRPLDNADIAERILPEIIKMGMEVKSAAVTEQRLYIQAVSPKMMAEVPRVGDAVQFGMVISNSEVGCGSLNMRDLIYTLRCTNGLISENIVRQNHVGRKGKGGFGELFDGEDAQEMYSDEARQADDKAFWLKVRDVMKARFTKERFDNLVGVLGKTTKVELEQPLETVEVLQPRFDWSEDEKESILNHLIKGGDMTQYGLLNAVTRAAQDLSSYDRAIEFEKQGGEIMLLTPTDLALN